MSGTCARIDFLKKHNIRFNENLSLYGIDTCLFTDIRKIDRNFYVLEERLEHDLSEKELNEAEKKKRSYLYLEAYKETARKNHFYIFFISLYELIFKIMRRI